jgi:ribosomal protein S18 acetylase RimI-like enzyme
MTIVIRQAGSDDAPLLSLIGAATFLETFVDVVPAAALQRHCTEAHGAGFYRDRLSSGEVAWLACSAGTGAPVGYALAAERGRQDLALRRIYVLSLYHRHGVGAQLMTLALAHARDRNLRSVSLSVYRGNEKALHFYGKHGFERTGRSEFDVGGQSFENLDMTRALDGSGPAAPDARPRRR